MILFHPFISFIHFNKYIKNIQLYISPQQIFTVWIPPISPPQVLDPYNAQDIADDVMNPLFLPLRKIRSKVQVSFVYCTWQVATDPFFLKTPIWARCPLDTGETPSTYCMYIRHSVLHSILHSIMARCQKGGKML